MATTNSISSYNYYYDASSERTPSSSLDKDAFLQLLVTQLQYQDPLNPTDDQQFLAQMAQFSALEQMQNMTKSTQQSQAYSLIGKTITATILDENTNGYVDLEGQVTSVVMRSGEAYLTVGPYEVPLEKVESIKENSYMGSIYSSMATSQNLALIGKTVQAITLDDEGNAKEFIEGVVDYVKFSNGTAILVIGDKEVYGTEVLSVSTEKMLIEKQISISEKDEETGEYNYVPKTITGVELLDNKAYLIVGGQKIEVDKINYVTEALQLVGKDISYAGTSGKASAVTIKNGIPYMIVNGKEISYTAYKGIATTTEE